MSSKKQPMGPCVTAHHPKPLPSNAHWTIERKANFKCSGLLSRGVCKGYLHFFENMGLVICLNLHRHSEEAGWGGGGIETVIEDWLRRVWRVQVSSSRQLEIAYPPTPNSIFFLGKGRAPDSPPNYPQLSNTSLVMVWRLKIDRQSVVNHSYNTVQNPTAVTKYTFVCSQ